VHFCLNWATRRSVLLNRGWRIRNRRCRNGTMGTWMLGAGSVSDVVLPSNRCIADFFVAPFIPIPNGNVGEIGNMDRFATACHRLTASGTPGCNSRHPPHRNNVDASHSCMNRMHFSHLQPMTSPRMCLRSASSSSRSPASVTSTVFPGSFHH